MTDISDCGATLELVSTMGQCRGQHWHRSETSSLTEIEFSSNLASQGGKWRGDFVATPDRPRCQFNPTLLRVRNQ